MYSSSKYSFFVVIILLITSGCTDNPYRDEDEADKSPASYGVLVHPMTNNHSAAPGFDTDFILTVYNIGSETETFDITILSKDEGIESVSFEGNVHNITVPADVTLPLITNVNLTSSATGKLKVDIKFSTEPNEENITTSQTVTLEVNADVTFGNQTKIGDRVRVHYAGILAKDSKLFDSSMEYVWDTYPYYNFGVSEANRHIEPLTASNIGCFLESTKDGVILSYVDTRFSAHEGGLRVGMEIYEFQGQRINTYEEFYDAINATFTNQTVTVSVVNETAGLDNYTVNMTDLGEFYEEFYPYYYQTWMDGKGFMGINAEEKTALNSDACADSRVMIVGFDNKMVGMYEGQTLAVRIPTKDAYGETGYSTLAGEDLLFLIEMVQVIEMVEIIEPIVEEEPEENVTQDYNMTVASVVDGDTFYLGNGDKVRMLGINTPESGRPYAQEATDFLTNMILGKEVTLVNDSKNGDLDSYGRLLAHVYVNEGISINYEESGDGDVDGGINDIISSTIDPHVEKVHIYINLTGHAMPGIGSDVTVTITSPTGVVFEESYILGNNQQQYIEYKTSEGEMIGDWEISLESNDPASDFSYTYNWVTYFQGNSSVNYEIIKSGYAFWYPYTSGTDLDAEYEAAQAFASNNTVGLWTESSYNLTIDYIEYDPEGDEAVGEYLVLTNHESYNVSMVGWFLQDEAAQTAYEFNFTISNNSSIRIYTGDGIDNSTTLYWGWHQGIWNNSGDFAIIQDENGYMVDSYRYS